MDGGTISVIALVVTNTAIVAYGYGMLNQKVKDISRRLGRLENILNNKLNS